MNTPIRDLPEAHSTKAARLLAAAGELLIGRGAKGFTVSDVAARAHVGKGTVYLYWPTKEDLLIGLIGRAFLRLLEDLLERLDSDPDLARPSRFCPAMLQLATNHPLVAALQRRDDDLLGVLTDHPRSVALDCALGPDAVLSAVLPIWRRNGLAREDWSVGDQIYALRSLITGVGSSLLSPGAGTVAVARPMDVLASSVTAILGPERANQKQLRAAASEISDFLRTARTTALGLIDPP
ncbi:MAG: TetR/AcrR family transcriptional regulator [Mycolicibacterium sp.]|uniref:TetR/AcrR family transcriptional regulator n=1 Tax=Mycolicibacterium sp. TaxID=2320850 RepID=UPI003D133394